jgi:hypothetical protein
VYLDANEQRCVRWIARSFEQNTGIVTREQAMRELNFRDDEYEVVMRRMEALGAIRSATNAPSGFLYWFRPLPHSVDVARELDRPRPAPSPPDMVQRIRAWARSKPALAWVIVVTVAIVFLATALNAIIDLCRKLGGSP